MAKKRKNGKAKARTGRKTDGETDLYRDSITFQTFAEWMDMLDDMIGGAGARCDVASCEASDLAVFVHNHGTAEDRAAALRAIMLVVKRVYERA